MNNLKHLQDIVEGKFTGKDLEAQYGLTEIKADLIDNAEYSSRYGKDSFKDFKKYYVDITNRFTSSEVKIYYDYYEDCVKMFKDKKNKEKSEKLIKSARDFTFENDLINRIIYNKKNILDREANVELPYIVEAIAVRGSACNINVSILSEELQSKIKDCIKIRGYFNQGDGGSSTVLYLLKLKPSEMLELLALVDTELVNPKYPNLHDHLDDIIFITKDQYLKGNSDPLDEEFYRDCNESSEYNTRKEILNFFEYTGDPNQIILHTENWERNEEDSDIEDDLNEEEDECDDFPEYERQPYSYITENPATFIHFDGIKYSIIIKTKDTDEAIATKKYIDNLMTDYYKMGMYFIRVHDYKCKEALDMEEEKYDVYELDKISLDEFIDKTFKNSSIILMSKHYNNDNITIDAYKTKSISTAVKKYEELMQIYENDCSGLGRPEVIFENHLDKYYDQESLNGATIKDLD